MIRWHRLLDIEEYLCWHRGTTAIKIYEIDEKDGALKV